MKNIFLNLKIIHIVYWLATISCYAALPELSSNDPIEFNEETQEVTLRGDAELISDKALIRADEIRLNNESLNTTASGDVRINMDDLRLVGECVEYNVSAETLNAGPFRAGNAPLYISGNHIEGPINDLKIDEANIFLGEPDCLSPNLDISCLELKRAQEGAPTEIVAHNIWFKIGCVPFFYLPYVSYTLEDIPFSIVNDYGQSAEYGFYLRNDIYFRITPCLKIGALVDYYKKRGVLLGPAFRYFNVSNCKTTFSDFQSGFIHDRGTEKQLGVDSVGRKTPRSRHFIEWYHQQQFTEDFQLTGQLRQWSDSNSLRDFRPKLFNNDNDPDNFAEAVYTGPNYFLTAFTRFSPNNFQNVPQRIPELNFNLLPTPIGCTSIFQTVNARIAHLHSNTPRRDHKLTTNRLDIFYGLHVPLNFDDIMTFTPVLGGQIDEYFNKNTSRGTFTRLRAQMGFDFQLNSYAQWDYCDATWGIKGLRHILRPIVQYRFIPQHIMGRGPIPKIDRRVFTTNIRPIDLNYQRDIDSARSQNVVRFGFENLFQTRGIYGSRDLAYLNIYQDYDIKKNLHNHHWSHLYTELGIAPAYWINFALYNRIDVRRPKISALDTSLILTDARFWSLGYITSFLHRDLHPHHEHDHRHKHSHIDIANRHQHSLRGTWNFSPRSSIAAEASYDAKLHQITKETFAFNTQISNAWGAELQVIHRRHAIRESKWEFSLLLYLLPLDYSLLPIPLFKSTPSLQNDIR